MVHRISLTHLISLLLVHVDDKVIIADNEDKQQREIYKLNERGKQ
jgi:hypothetical protein